MEVKINWWEDPEVNHDKDTFWIMDAMKAAVGLYWMHNHQKPDFSLDEVNIRLDKERGVVVLTAP